MSFTLSIHSEKCICCRKCIRICPSQVFEQEGKNTVVSVVHPENCIVCGHCIGVCPVGAVEHTAFPPEKVHEFNYAGFPAPEQMMLLCQARRSNRAFTEELVPEEMLGKILHAAHCAPTASNSQQVEFTLVTDPVKLKLITEFTLGVFGKALKKLRNPLLRPLIKVMMPDHLRYIPVFERLLQEYAAGNDLILRKAKAVILIHTPEKSRFGCQDANLAYQNGSLMAECLGVSQFYTGFVCSAVAQDKNRLEKQLGIEGQIHAGMALGMPAFRYKNYFDRKEIKVNRIID